MNERVNGRKIREQKKNKDGKFCERKNAQTKMSVNEKMNRGKKCKTEISNY